MLQFEQTDQIYHLQLHSVFAEPTRAGSPPPAPRRGPIEWCGPRYRPPFNPDPVTDCMMLHSNSLVDSVGMFIHPHYPDHPIFAGFTTNHSLDKPPRRHSTLRSHYTVARQSRSIDGMDKALWCRYDVKHPSVQGVIYIVYISCTYMATLLLK